MRERAVGLRAARRPRQELQDDQKKELREAFELFDTDKKGSIDYHELKARPSSRLLIDGLDKFADVGAGRGGYRRCSCARWASR
jgi:hypothetical protein